MATPPHPKTNTTLSNFHISQLDFAALEITLAIVSYIAGT